jgi:type II secretory pathway component GspD/PulD (secretin)
MKKWLVMLLLLCISTGVYAEEARYSFNFPIGTSLRSALYSVASVGGREIIVNTDDKSPLQVQMTLHNKTIDEAINLLSLTYNFNWAVEDNTILVTPAADGTRTQRFVLKNATVKLLKEELLSFLPEGKVRINPEYNSVTVDGTPEVLWKVANIIEQMDQPVEQIFVVAQMVEVTRSDALKLGFEYTTPSYDNSVVPYRAQFTVTSDLSKTIGTGKIIARPAISAFNGQEATLLMGDKVPVITNSTSNGTSSSTITFQDVGAQLKVTPYVNDKGKQLITLDLEPSVSSVAAWITSGDSKAPQISTRSAKTKIRVKSGENIVIGGLMKDSDIQTLSGIPGLMNLPILGKLFQHRERNHEVSEVFFVVTPYIVSDDMTVSDIQKAVKTGKLPEKVISDKVPNKDFESNTEPSLPQNPE